MTLTPAEYRKASSALTTAINSDDPRKVISTVNRAWGLFETRGYPDDWSSRWKRAYHDALVAYNDNATTHAELACHTHAGEYPAGNGVGFRHAVNTKVTAM